MAEVTKTVKVLFGCQAPLVNEIHLNLIKVLDVVGCAGWHSLAGGQGHYFRMGRLEMWSLFLFFFLGRKTLKTLFLWGITPLEFPGKIYAMMWLSSWCCFGCLPLLQATWYLDNCNQSLVHITVNKSYLFLESGGLRHCWFCTDSFRSGGLRNTSLLFADDTILFLINLLMKLALETV